jgi:hypothetical protein
MSSTKIQSNIALALEILGVLFLFGSISTPYPADILTLIISGFLFIALGAIIQYLRQIYLSNLEAV